MISLLAFVIGISWGHGNVVGNGGSIVSCPSSVTSSFHVFSKDRAVVDLFEGSVRGETYRQLLRFRGQSFKTAYPRAIRLFFKPSPFLQSVFLERLRLPNVRFSETPLQRRQWFSWSTLSYGCEVQTAAMLRAPSAYDAGHLVVDRRIWSSLETDQKIALMIHESLQAISLARNDQCTVNYIQNSVAFLLSDRSLSVGRDRWQLESSVLCDSSLKPNP